jgi:hypothetical protein
MTTVCTCAVGGITLAWVIRIGFTRREQGRAVRVSRTEGSPRSALPRLSMFGVRLVLQGLDLVPRRCGLRTQG